MALNNHIVSRALANAKSLEYVYLEEKLQIQGKGFKFPENSQPKAAVRYDGKVYEWTLLGLEAPSMENMDEIQFYFLCEKPGDNFDGEVICLQEYEILPGEMLHIVNAMPDFPLDIVKDADLWKIFGGNWSISGHEETCLRIDPEKKTISTVPVIKGHPIINGNSEIISTGIEAWKDLKEMNRWVKEENLTTIEAVERLADQKGFDLPF